MSAIASQHVAAGRIFALTVDATKVSGSGALTDFPVLVTDACFGAAKDLIFAIAHHSGRDVRFYSDVRQANQLACDIAAWNSSAKTCRVWVKATIDGTTNTTIYMLCGRQGNASLARNAAFGAEAVWPKPTYDMMSEQVGMDRSAIRAHASYGVSSTPPQAVFIRDTTAYASFPSLIRLMSGRLLCAFREGPEHLANVGGNVYVYSSENDGRTWASLSSVINASWDLRDPGLLQRANGDVWMTYSKGNADSTSRTEQYVISANNGATWGSELTASAGRTLAATRGKPIERTNGDVCVPCFETSSFTYKPYIAIYNGSTWTEYDVVGSFGDMNEWSVVESTTANDLIGFFRNEVTYDIYRAYFTNATTTWGAAVLCYTTDTASTSGTPSEVQRHPVSGNLLMAVSPLRASKSVMLRSTDEGVNWLSTEQVSAITAPLLTGGGFYESFCKLSNEELGYAFYCDTATTTVPAKVYFTRVTMDSQNRLTGPAHWAGANGVTFDGVDDRFSLCGTAGDTSFIQNTGVFSITWRGSLDVPNAARLNGFCGSTVTSLEKGFLLWHEDRAGSADRAVRVYLTTGVPDTPVIDSQTVDAVIIDTAAHTVTVTGDATNVVFYIDGSAVSDDAATMGTKSSGDSTRPMDIGRYPHATTPGGYFDGNMQFLGLRADTVSADWAATVHNSLSAPNTFIAYSG